MQVSLILYMLHEFPFSLYLFKFSFYFCLFLQIYLFHFSLIIFFFLLTPCLSKAITFLLFRLLVPITVSVNNIL